MAESGAQATKSFSITAIGAATSRVTRGWLLFSWVVGLTVVALGSVDGSLADLLLEKRNSKSFLPDFDPIALRIAKQTETTACPSPDQVLYIFLREQDNAPPIVALLDAVFPQWGSILNPKEGRCTLEQQQRLQQTYRGQFSKVAERLRSYARDDATDPKSVVIDDTVLSPDFQQQLQHLKRAPLQVKLPPEVQDWMLKEKARIKKESQARSLIGTFILLSVLGAFGSLIFLIRDYISEDTERKLSAYIFRPILGIFLAVAVFIVDVLTHSVISSASILDIRYEPLYILALAAGLLSERVYDAVRNRANRALEEYNQSGNPTSPTDSARPAP